MANTYLTWTPSQNGTRTKFTTSFWVKRSGLSSGQSPIFSSDINNSNNTYSMMYFTNDFLAFFSKDNTTTLQFLTNARFRDVNGWYHIVIAFDSAQATASNRVKFYVNGEQITSFDTATYPPQNADNTWFNKTDEHFIGTRSYDNANYFDGLISHFNFCDGYAYQASDFGSTDSTTGEWQINTAPSVTYGTNGFFILKDGNSVTDQSGNSNNWTVAGGTLTNTEDNPSNVFCTMNPLINVPDIGFTEGNTKIVNYNSGRHFTNYGTLGFSTGKYYWEAQASVPLTTKWTIGLSDVKNQSAYQQTTSASMIVGNQATSYSEGDAIGWYSTQINKNGNQIAGSLTAIASSDIMMVACDADNGKIYFGKNGTWRVANSTTFDSDDNDTTFTTGESYTPAFSNEYCGWKINFGNGYFGTSAVSSAGTNASGIGIFEYDVPTGYTALSTKGLNL